MPARCYHTQGGIKQGSVRAENLQDRSDIKDLLCSTLQELLLTVCMAWHWCQLGQGSGVCRMAQSVSQYRLQASPHLAAVALLALSCCVVCCHAAGLMQQGLGGHLTVNRPGLKLTAGDNSTSNANSTATAWSAAATTQAQLEHVTRGGRILPAGHIMQRVGFKVLAVVNTTECTGP